MSCDVSETTEALLDKNYQSDTRPRTENSQCVSTNQSPLNVCPKELAEKFPPFIETSRTEKQKGASGISAANVMNYKLD